MRLRGLLACVVLAGCGLAPLPEAEPVDVDVAAFGIQVDGPVLEVASGEIDGDPWSVVALRAADGDVCLFAMVAGVPEGGPCGPASFPFSAGWSVVGAGGRPLVHGRLPEDARGARVVTDAGGTEVRVVSLARLGVEGTAMAGLLPAGARPSAVEVLDSGGAVLDRIELGPIP